ncbi:MAG: glutamate 5-kinase [Gammaproteobacteria bacterium]
MKPSSSQSAAEHIASAQRIVIKIGSALLVDRDSGLLDAPWFEDLVADIARLRKAGREVLVVSSGAIALGRRYLGLRAGALRLEESQAAAAAGQVRLAHAWQNALGRHEIPVAQVLLTLGDTEQRRRYLNARGTLETLLALGAVPVINENDTVATEEIRYGDNDRLAARVAQMIGADCLLLLSDTDGLHTADPARDPAAKLVREVHAVTPEIEAMAGEAATDVGAGGMITKVAAGRIALAAGCHMVIASGRVRHPVRAIEAGAPCTWFIATLSPGRVRKQWIAGSLQPRGEIIVDDGAAAALAGGKSLLPAGVVRVSGDFDRGDAVLIRDQRGLVLAHGLSAYAAHDAVRIIGLRSAETEAVLGYRGREELVHRNDLAMVARND